MRTIESMTTFENNFQDKRKSLAYDMRALADEKLIRNAWMKEKTYLMNAIYK